MEQKTELRIYYESLSAGPRKGLNSALAIASGIENEYLPSMVNMLVLETAKKRGKRRCCGDRISVQ
ncbi:MAG: hypothetical protein ABSA46_19210 [Thermodesulfovibrionales bacterium]|jgi:hypothetical protein